MGGVGMEKITTAAASPNIAFIKYWGKRANLAKTPVNDSISMTLDSSILRTETTLMLSDSLKNDVFVLNGMRREDEELNEALGLWRKRLEKKGFNTEVHALVVSNNNFPTASGIASSASGFAALAEALASAFGITETKEKSILARLGSGSACRSVLGGFVRWRKGESEDGEDSYAVQIAPKQHWPNLVDVLAIVSKKEKKIGSRAGMKQTVETSELYSGRVRALERRIPEMEAAIRNKDFEKLALGMMRESDSMHAAMLDTWPPIIYLNDVSREIIYAVEEYNKEGVRVAYTFDAGPNAHLITTMERVDDVKSFLKGIDGIINVLVVPAGDGPKLLKPNTALAEKTLEEVSL
jgi:diphosphomevalonate decarboxylase